MRTGKTAAARAGLAAAFFVCAFAATALAQPRTDQVTLANGDRITGEIVRLDRGQLEFKTDDAGTLYLEWEKLVSVVATTRVFEVTTSDGRRFLGGIEAAAPGSLAIVAPDGVTLTMSEVTDVSPIGATFWRKIDGSVNVGFSYTRSSGVAQLNLNADTVYRRPRFELHLNGAYTATRQEADTDGDDRGSVGATYLRFLGRRLALMGLGRVESNESLGLVLRTEGGGGLGARLVHSNRAQLLVGSGVMVNQERGVDVEPTKNVEGVVLLRTSYFTYDRPKTAIDIDVQYFPSLSNFGRHRLQLDAAVRREIIKDVTVSLNLYNSYDSQPPSAEADTNDVGIVLSVGWTF